MRVLRKSLSFLLLLIIVATFARGETPSSRIALPIIEHSSSKSGHPIAPAIPFPSDASKFPRVRIKRILEPSGTEVLELSCEPAGTGSSPVCLIRVFHGGNLFGTGKLDAQTAMEIVAAFLKELPKGRLHDSQKTGRDKPVADALIIWQAASGGKSAGGTITKKQAGQTSKSIPELDAVIGLEGRLFREVGP